MVDISELDEKSITFNGKPCAAVYKADAGCDEKGEFVLITELNGGYKTRIRVEELTVNGVEQHSAAAAAYELNRFIGSFKKGGGGDVKTVCYRMPDESGNVSLTATDIGAAAVGDLRYLAYKRLMAGAYTGKNGFLVRLRPVTGVSYTVVSIIGHSGGAGTPINTTLQLTITTPTGTPPAYSNISGINYGYRLTDVRIFAMAESGNAYGTYLWLPVISFPSFMGVMAYDRIGGIGSDIGNIVSGMQVASELPADGKRLAEVVISPTS